MQYLITGAGRGIGYDTALTLAQQPDAIVLALSRQTEGLHQLADHARRLTGRHAVHYLAYDLAQPEPQRLLDWAAAFGPIHGLLNNAGLLINKPFAELTDADWRRLFEVNVFGPVSLIRTLLPLMADPAHILNVSSMGGFQGSSKFPGLSAYSAGKAALANLSECLAEELKTNNISVNALALGAVQTEMLAEAFPGYQAPVQSQDMGQFMAWFLTQGHRFFNGKVLPVSVSTP